MADYAVLYGAIRERAFAYWRGPTHIKADKLGGKPFFGWAVVSLCLQTGWPHHLESRSVFANPYDSSQKLAVLRAVSWDAEVTHSWLRSHNAIDEFSIPARFVSIPMDKLRFLMDMLKEINIPIVDTHVDDPEIPIRRIRLEWSYSSSVFERVWQPTDANLDELTGIWDSMWNGMADLLTSRRQIATKLDEIFTAAPLPLHYDFKVYRAEKIAPSPHPPSNSLAVGNLP